ncbi:hypothetical protein [Chelativorans alearense]|uniref:hypothetical protein n=1 Tax=Chelativorans alearense TaxID=2681495 RepID=UPI0013D4E692|nr:hypothetical protein [Chelativorans alearense]
MFSRFIALLAAGEAANVKRRVKAAVVGYVLVAATGLPALAFLLLAAYLAVAARWGPLASALWFGSGLAVLCGLTFVVYRTVAGAQRRKQEQKRAADAGLLMGASALTVLPALLGRRRGAAALLLALAGLAGYAAYREHERGDTDEPHPAE